MRTNCSLITSFILSIVMLTAGNTNVMAQEDERKFRIAKVEIDSAYLEQYKVALAENAKASVKEEPGVLTLQAVFDKTHLKTPHFLKYKSGTLKMVKSLELVDVAPIAIAIKPEFVKENE